MRTVFTSFLLIIGLAATGSASAMVVYNVGSAITNCGTSPHGLWTSSYLSSSGNCGNYFDFQAGSTLTVDINGASSSAVLNATAINSNGVSADIDISFGGYQNSPAGINIKNGGGGNPNTWDFFTTLSGDIDFSNGASFDINSLYGGTSFQLGFGANDKTGVFGASAWIVPLLAAAPDAPATGSHWDLNIALTPTAVPEPGSLALLGIGAIGFAFARRRKTAKSIAMI